MLRARASITGLSGGVGVMTLYAAPAITPEDGTLATLVSHRLRDALTVLVPRLGVGITYTGDSVVQQISPATGTLTNEFGVTPWTVTGSAAYSHLPSASAACVGWATGAVVGGRMLRGRTFVSGLTSFSLATDGSILEETRTLLNTFATSWNDPGTTDCVAGIWKRPKGAVAGSFHGISGWTIPTQLAVLRSRRD